MSNQIHIIQNAITTTISEIFRGDFRRICEVKKAVLHLEAIYFCHGTCYLLKRENMPIKDQLALYQRIELIPQSTTEFFENNRECIINNWPEESALAAKEVKSLRATMQEIVALCREGAKAGAGEAQNQYCAIDTQATDALTMINNFIETSGSYGEVQVNAHSFQIQGIVADITREYTMACRGKGIHFSIETRELPYENLRGDSRRIKQIWSNMLEKAYYHTEKGGRIKTRYGEQVIDEQHVNIEITVESNGVVGEKYTLTKGLVEVMHGTFHISYDENSGSRITASVPVESGKNPQTGTKDFGNRRVLIFDDNSVTSSYHAAIISRLGISCEIVSSLAEALCFMGEAYDEGNSYDICLLNWYMAGARDCIAALKSSCMRGGMEIACSTNEKERMEPRMRECGVDYVVERPVYQATLYHFFSELFRA